MMAILVAAALLAVAAGVLLAALDRPQAEADPRLQRLSLVLVIGTPVTAVAGVAYALLA